MVSFETIYTLTYERIKEGEPFKQHLRQGKKKRSKRLTGKKKRIIINNKQSIYVRPDEVKSKMICGHGEGNTVEGEKTWIYCNFCRTKDKVLAGFSLIEK